MSYPRNISLACPQTAAVVFNGSRQQVAATRVGSIRKGKICIPEFEEQARDWMGCSEVVLQFNYDATKKFVIM